MIQLKPLKTNEELMELIELAQADNHTVVGATHLLIKHNEIVGYMSIGGITHVHNWFHSDKCTASDSMIAISQAEAVMANSGVLQYYVACEDTSPFFSKMEKLGFTPMFNTNLFKKEV